MRFRDQPELERFKQASQTGGRKMKCLQFKSSLGGADEACGAQTEERAHQGRRFAVQARPPSRFGVRSSFGPWIMMRRVSNVGMYVQSGESEPQCVKVQLRLSGLCQKIKRRLQECVCF